MNYGTKLRNKNRVWRKVIGLSEPACELVHYDAENRLLRLIAKLEQEREISDWIARADEDPEGYSSAPILHNSNIPLDASHA